MKEERMAEWKSAPGGARVIVVDAAGGLSGDMFLAGLCALGAEPARVAREVRTLPGLERFSIAVERVKPRGIAAVRARVRCSPKARERDLAAILSMIERSRLDERVKMLAAKAFTVLGEAEGRVHGVRASRVHFHEVGAVDSIVDIVGSVAALAMLGYPRLYHRPFRLGSGFIRVAHGSMPVPAPATIEILRGRTVSLGEDDGEVVTPTGAALMRSLATEISGRRAFVPRRVVYAAGTREEGAGPGMLRLIEAEERAFAGTVAVLRTTIDDMNPEHYGYVQERLFEAGALEVYLAQLIMKKGRPGVQLTVLCEEGGRDRLIDVLFEETTTLGVRVGLEERVELERWTEKVETRFGAIQVKRARLRDGRIKTAPEYEACRRAAAAARAPIRDVYEAARAERPRKKRTR
jgi:uncharacterized protein (TIGR00299 family) protein